jgi:hypothetical protein
MSESILKIKKKSIHCSKAIPPRQETNNTAQIFENFLQILGMPIQFFYLGRWIKSSII